MRTLWTDEELFRAKALHRSGLTWDQVAVQIGRSSSACSNAIARANGYRAYINNAYDGPAIALTKECTRLRRDARVGSECLRTACLDLFQRTANRYQISMDDAMAAHLGFHSPARIVRAPYKTASAMRRLAA